MFKNAIDLLFEDLARDKPDHFAVRQYAKFKLAAGNIHSRGVFSTPITGKSVALAF